ncbi:MAG: InlB B-repeat-containing protein [Alphaproteobacteria bacterium]|nr:InlB B-repeat-containing protein [Alphaproteobacteria bacterium]
MSRFLRVFAIIFGLFFVGNAFAAGYVCNDIKQYSSCNTGYYMTYNGVANTTPRVGNACTACQSGCTCANNVMTCEIAVTCSKGYYIAAGATTCSTQCESGYYCPGGTYTISGAGATSIMGRTGCPSGYGSSAAGSNEDYDCYLTTTPGKYIATANSSTQSTCEAGYYCPSDTVYYGSTGTRTSCGTGYTSAAGSDEASDCYGASYTCSAGYYLNGTSCKECTAGYFCPGGSLTYNGGINGRTACSSVSSAYSNSFAGAKSQYDCYMTCRAGTRVVTKGATSCNLTSNGAWATASHNVFYGQLSPTYFTPYPAILSTQTSATAHNIHANMSLESPNYFTGSLPAGRKVKGPTINASAIRITNTGTNAIYLSELGIYSEVAELDTDGRFRGMFHPYDSLLPGIITEFETSGTVNGAPYAVLDSELVPYISSYSYSGTILQGGSSLTVYFNAAESVAFVQAALQSTSTSQTATLNFVIELYDEDAGEWMTIFAPASYPTNQASLANNAPGLKAYMMSAYAPVYCDAGTYAGGRTVDMNNIEDVTGCTSCSSVSFTDSDSESCTIDNGTGARTKSRTCYRNDGPVGATLSTQCTGSSNCDSYTYDTCMVESCNSGYVPNDDNTECVPNIVSCGSGEQLNGISCEPCAAGYYCTGGDFTPNGGIQGRTACATGSYSSEGQSSCTICTAGTTTSSTGSSSCDVTCPGADGVYAWSTPSWSTDNTVSNVCVASSCNSGYYKNDNTCNSCAEDYPDFPYSNNRTTGGYGYCYRQCDVSDVDNSTSVSGIQYADGVGGGCEPESCEGGYYIDGDYCSSCPYSYPDSDGDSGEAYCYAACPSKTGYTLDGGRDYYDTDDTCSYIPNTYTVSFDANGGSGGQSSSVTATYDSDMPSISTTAPTRTGYTFMGWYDNADYTNGTQYYTAAGTSARTWNKTSNTTLYAGWEIISYTITISKNGGSGSLTVNGVTQTGTPNVSFTCNHGTTFTLPAWGNGNALTRTKMVFTGWSVSGTVTCNSTKTITAQWATPTCNAGTGVATTSLNSVSSNKPVCNRSSKCGYYCSATQTGTAGATSLNTTCTKTSAGYYAAAGATSQTQAAAGYYAAAGACEQTKIKAGCYSTGNGSSVECPNSCPTVETGWTMSTTTGLTAITQCTETTTPSASGSPIASVCSAGTLTKTATTSGTWGTATASGLNATAGYYVNGTTCSACGGSNYYCPGGTTARKTVNTGYYSTGGSSTTRTGQTKCEAGNYCSSGVIYPCSGTNQWQPDAGQTSCDTVTDGMYKSNNYTLQNCGTGYYCKSGVQTQCPNGGTTASATASVIGSCYKTGLPLSVSNGAGTQRCFYTSGLGTSAVYDSSCDTKTVTSCNAKYYRANASDLICTTVGTGHYSAAGSLTRSACPTADSGWTVTSPAGATVSDCYETKTGSAISAYCDGGVLKRAASSTSAYSSTVSIATALNAVTGAIVNGQTCTQCSAGTYSAGDKATTCSSISAGCYGGAGSGTSCPNQCTAGTYRSSTGGKTQSDCSNVTAGCYGAAGATESCPAYCAANTYSNAGASSCTACPTDYKNSGNSAAAHAGSASCIITVNGGYYIGTAGDNSGNWDKCAGGTYKAQHTVAYGSTSSCTSASKGYYVGTTGASSQTACPLGAYTNATGQNTCVPCQNGTTTSGSGQTSCNATCENSNNVTSWATASMSNNNVINLCKVSGCNEDTYYTAMIETGYQNTCTACGEHSTNPENNTLPVCACELGHTKDATVGGATTSITGCQLITGIKCSSGYYLPAQATACELCDPGHYCPNDTDYSWSTNIQGRIECEPGTYQPNKGKTSCTEASAGYYVSGTAQTGQTLCTGATYAENTGQESCTSCPSSKFYPGLELDYYLDETGIHSSREGCSAVFRNISIDNGALSEALCFLDTNGDYGTANALRGTWGCESRQQYLTCDGGYYTPITTPQFAYPTLQEMVANTCTGVGSGYWSAADSLTRTTCGTGLVTCGSGACANEEDDCGRKLHAGDDVVYLRSAKRGTKALNVKVGDKTFYGALSTSLTGALKVKDGTTTYSVVNDYQ